MTDHKYKHRAPPHKKAAPNKSRTPSTATLAAYSNEIAPPILDYSYINLRGYGLDGKRSCYALCGDDPPTITGGYAKWTVVDRPMMQGVTVFQGYDPVKMTLSLRFGVWDGNGWHVDSATADQVEDQITRLEWMAGIGRSSGMSPIVYANSYGPSGGSTNLIPSGYQATVGISGNEKETYLWPWVISDQIQWGKAWRSQGGDGAGGTPVGRIYQECTLVLTNFQGLTTPPKQQSSGTYYIVQPGGRNTVLLIAEDPSFHAIAVQQLAHAIRTSHNNNPIQGSRIHLSDHTVRWPIPVGKSVYVPHTTV